MVKHRYNHDPPAYLTILYLPALSGAKIACESALNMPASPGGVSKPEGAGQAARPVPGAACVCAVCPAGGRTGYRFFIDLLPSLSGH